MTTIPTDVQLLFLNYGNQLRDNGLLGPVRPDVTTLVTGNTEQRVTQTRNCTATSD